MNKCPSCGGTNNVLVRICAYCGKELPASGGHEGTPVVDVSTGSSAAELCGKIQKDLVLVTGLKPSHPVAAFFSGVATALSVGVWYCLLVAVRAFGRNGQSPGQIVLQLEQNLRAAETSFKGDVEVRKLLEAGRAELVAHQRQLNRSRLSFFFGICAAPVLVVAVLWPMRGRLFHGDSNPGVAMVGSASTSSIPAQGGESEQDRQLRLANEARLQTEQEAKSFLARNVAVELPSKPLDNGVVVLVFSEKAVDDLATRRMVDLLRERGRAPRFPFFTPQAFSDRIIERLYLGSPSLVEQLKLERFAKELLLVKIETRDAKDTLLKGSVNNYVRLDAQRISTADGSISASFSVTAEGSGIARDDAHSLAMERALKALDKKLAQ